MSWRVTQVRLAAGVRMFVMSWRVAAALLCFWVWRRPSGAGGGREGFAPLGRAVIGVEGVLLGSNRNPL